MMLWDLRSLPKSADTPQLTGLHEKMSALSNYLDTAVGQRNGAAAAWPDAK
jgi:hypothetical protein